MSDGFLNHLNHVVQAAQKEDGSSTTAAGHVVVLTKEADALPEEVKRITDPRKLNCQTPYFRCPAWATLPPTRFHLHCTRRGTDCSPLNLDRYAFYLFGKNRICDYILEHPSISAVHAALVFHGQQCCFVLVDLNSTNGVSINGKRVEKQKPIPLTVGSSLRFGFSERVYELRAGAPPAKRVREESTSADASSSSRPKTMSREEVLANLPTQQHVSEPHLQPAIVAAAHTPAPASSPSPPAPPTALAAVDEALAALTSPPPPPAVVEESIHLYQLVIKHKDLDKPISRGHNKGEAITRSLADALRLAQDILDAHARKTSTPSPTTARAPVRYMWSVEDFIEAVRNLCEATTFKKDGDLGIVERGNFSDDFDRAAFALRRGEVSPPVETPLGVHLLFRCD